MQICSLLSAAVIVLWSRRVTEGVTRAEREMGRRGRKEDALARLRSNRGMVGREEGGMRRGVDISFGV